MFTGNKLAQMAAFFTQQQGGTIDTVKLMKLLYLADREAVDHHGAPISYDRMVSMPHGPLLSNALNLVHGYFTGPSADQWDAWLQASGNHQVTLKKSADRAGLDELSDQDIEVLAKVWEQFGPMTKWQIRDYTHDNLPEWRDPKGSSFPIGDMELVRALGRTDDEAEEIAQDLREQRELDHILSSM